MRQHQAEQPLTFCCQFHCFMFIWMLVLQMIIHSRRGVVFGWCANTRYHSLQRIQWGIGVTVLTHCKIFPYRTSFIHTPFVQFKLSLMDSQQRLRLSRIPARLWPDRWEATYYSVIFYIVMLQTSTLSVTSARHNFFATTLLSSVSTALFYDNNKTCKENEPSIDSFVTKYFILIQLYGTE